MAQNKESTVVEKSVQELSPDQIMKTLQTSLEKDLSAQQRLELLQKTMFKGFTPIEISLTVQKFKSMGADILKGDVWAYKDSKGNLIVIASRSFLQIKAEQNPEFDGLQSGVICDKDEFSINTVTGEASHKINSFKDRGPILGAWAIGWRKNGKPICVLADIKDYDKHQFIWNSHKSAMITKTAESLALRKFANLGYDVLGEGEYTPDNEKVIEKQKKPDISKMSSLNEK